MQRTMIGAAGAVLLLVTPALAERVSRESDITSLRLGQHIYVDDGTCPAGQIKEITGSKLTPQGVAFTRKCLDRRNMRQ
ncbi:hypothetical protein ASC80_08015 [Afipia sp. Root123D2]|uniref:DUF6719 family protein n=1 Tax=Afipia sp. Root123D2 TaxID=1736436 RepID=UPI0006F96454|nr:DUF6719 family protein [Afipia sp. Root123D2]KQW23581.1 hypothetical protein ASC80_08015 [Afipia sp. Root123D2]